MIATAIPDGSSLGHLSCESPEAWKVPQPQSQSYIAAFPPIHIWGGGRVDEEKFSQLTSPCNVWLPLGSNGSLHLPGICLTTFAEAIRESQGWQFRTEMH